MPIPLPPSPTLRQSIDLIVELGLGGRVRDIMINESYVQAVYALGELYSGTAKDISHKGNHGTYVGSGFRRGVYVPLPENHLGTEFTNGTSYITVPDDGVSGTGGLSLAGGSIDLAFFIYTTTNDATVRAIVQKQQQAYGNGWHVALQNGGIKFQLRVANATVFDVSTVSGLVSDGNWHFVHCYYDPPSNDVRIYVDGLLVKQVLTGNTDPATTTVPLRIGAFNDHSGSNGFIGSLALVLVGREGNIALSENVQTARIWTNVSTDLRSDTPLTCRYGITGTRITDFVANTGVLTFALDNSEGNSVGKKGFYSPGHFNAREGFRVHAPVRLSFDFAGIRYYKFVGQITAINPEGGQYLSRSTHIMATDWLDVAARSRFPDAETQADMRSTDALKYLIDHATTPPPAADVLDGTQIFGYVLDQSRIETDSMLSEIQRIAASEIMYVFLRGNRTGGMTLKTETRFSRQSQAIQSILNDSMSMMEAAHDIKNVVNETSITFNSPVVDAASTSVLWSLYTSGTVTHAIQTNETITFDAPYTDPEDRPNRVGGTALVTPVAYTDYVANALASGAGSDLTASLTVSVRRGANVIRVTVTNRAQITAYFTKFQVRGKSIQRNQPTPVVGQSRTSIRKYGISAIRVDMPYQQSMAVAASLGQAVLDQYAEPASRPERVMLQASKTPTNRLIPKQNWRVEYVSSAETVQYPRTYAAYAIDSDDATFWHTEWTDTTWPHQIIVNLGAEYLVNGFRYLTRQDGNKNGRIGWFNFYTSVDGVTWQEVSEGLFPDVADVQQVVFPQVLARYVRFKGYTDYGNSGMMAVAELDVIGPESLAQHAVGREVGDLVGIAETQTGIAVGAGLYINAIELIARVGMMLDVTWTLAPSWPTHYLVSYSGPVSGIHDLDTGPLTLTAIGVYTLQFNAANRYVELYGVSGGGGGGATMYYSPSGGGGGGGAASLSGMAVAAITSTQAIYTAEVGGGGTGGTPTVAQNQLIGTTGGRTLFKSNTTTFLSLGGGTGGGQETPGYGGTVLAGIGVNGGNGATGTYNNATGNAGNGSQGGSSGAGGGGGSGGAGGQLVDGTSNPPTSNDWRQPGGPGGSGAHENGGVGGAIEGPGGNAGGGTGGGTSSNIAGGGGGAGGGVFLNVTGLYYGGGGGGAAGGGLYPGGVGGRGGQGFLQIKKAGTIAAAPILPPANEPGPEIPPDTPPPVEPPVEPPDTDLPAGWSELDIPEVLPLPGTGFPSGWSYQDIGGATVPTTNYTIVGESLVIAIAATEASMFVAPQFGPTVDVPTGSYVNVPAGSNIQTYIDANPAGTTYYLRAGKFRHQTIVPKAGDVLWGEYGAIITGAKDISPSAVTWTYDAANARYYCTGQTQGISFTSNPSERCRLTTGGALGWGPYPFPRCEYPEDVFVDNVPLRAVDTLANLITGTFFFDYAADRIYIKDNPAGHEIETSVTQRCIASNSINGVTLRNLVFEKYAALSQDSCVTVGPNWTVTRCAFRYNHGIGMKIGAGLTARFCQFNRNAQMGVGGTGNGTLIEYCEMAYNNFAGYNEYWEAGATKFTFTDGLTVRHCHVHHNSGAGLWTDIDNINILYEYNTVEYNGTSGIGHEISFECIIRYNTVRGNAMGLVGDGTTNKPYPFWVEGAGITISNSRGVECYGNLVIDNWNNICAIEAHRGWSLVYGGTVWELKNMYVHDNTIRLTAHPGYGGGRTGILDIVDTHAYSAGQNNRFEANSYTLPNNGVNYFFRHDVEMNDATWLATGFDSPDGTITRV